MANLPLRSNWLLLIRALWIGVAALAASVVVTSIVVRFQSFDTLSPSNLPGDWTPELLRATLAQRGLSVSFYVAYNLVFAYLVLLVQNHRTYSGIGRWSRCSASKV